LVAHDHNFKLKNFLQTINVMQEHRLKINAEDLNIKQQAVHLATVYKAKGQEWQHVFLLHCVDRKWGNKRQRNLLPLPEGILQNTDVSQKERNEDERRVFYVALTRASKSVTITYPETIVQDNRTANKSPSQFLLEVGPTKQLEDKKLLAQADQHLAKLIEPPPQRVPTNDEKQFFKNLVADFKLSVTALNSYLRDPQEFVENNLLRVPRAKPMPMSFGTAVHSALEKLYRQYLLTGELPDQQFLLTKFEQALKKEILTETDFKQRLKHGQKVLANYHEKTAAKPLPTVVEVERSVGYGWSTAILDRDIALTGKLDRIDWVDRAKKLVRVVDYKTGKPKTNGYIEGTLKSLPLSKREQALPKIIRGPYKRQLIFYKLLTELDRSFNATMVEGMFEFVEPYDKRTGKLMPRNFVITKDEVKALKNLIREVMKEIRGLEFLKLM
jgi:ATP-dependent DNA helicase UvrD/PcrA